MLVRGIKTKMHKVDVKQGLHVPGFASVKSTNEERVFIQQSLFMITQYWKSLCLVRNHL